MAMFVLASSGLAANLAGCGDDSIDRTGRSACAVLGTSTLSYTGEFAGEPATAELVFAPVLHVELTGTIQTEFDQWTLQVSFRDGVGYGHLDHVETGELRSVRLRFVTDGIELRIADHEWQKLDESPGATRSGSGC